MKEPEEVAVVMRLHALGWGSRRIAREPGISRTTVMRYLAQGGWVRYRSAVRARHLDGLEEWLGERFKRHRGNAQVVRQELLSKHAVDVPLLLGIDPNPSASAGRP